MLVEQGRLRWDSTLAEVFPDWSPRMQAAWRPVTLEWLCSNRGGAPNDLGPSGIWTQLWNAQGTPREGRRLLLEKLTVLPPASTPGTTYEYSNAGFSLAGHMLETVMNRPWEDLLTEHLFRPLAMESGGFGVPATPRHIDQPWGHSWLNNLASPVEPGPTADNPPAIGPAGTVHCSLIDLARYVAFHLAGHASGADGLSQAAFLKLHTAVPGNADYAYGWTVLPRSWALGDALTHAGSNVQWYSVIWMAPNRAFGIVALCNVAGSGNHPGITATSQIVTRMIQDYPP
jgi:CubicO group peptidase (beta-lactamase class C family)